MSEPLGKVIAAAIEGFALQNDERLRQLIREELAKWKPAQDVGGYDTPPRAAVSRGISVKRIRSLMESGAVEYRAKNPGSKHPKWEINLASLDAALRGEQLEPEPGATVTTAERWAAAKMKRGG